METLEEHIRDVSDEEILRLANLFDARLAAAQTNLMVLLVESLQPKLTGNLPAERKS